MSVELCAHRDIVKTHQNTHGRQKPRSGVNAQPHKDKDETENGQQSVTQHNVKNDTAIGWGASKQAMGQVSFFKKES